MSAGAHNLRYIDAVDRTGLRYIDAVDRTGLYTVIIMERDNRWLLQKSLTGRKTTEEKEKMLNAASAILLCCFNS